MCFVYDNISVIQVYINQILSAARKAPLPPSPFKASESCAGAGVVVALFIL
jgi:hypothetical protein